MLRTRFFSRGYYAPRAKEGSNPADGKAGGLADWQVKYLRTVLTLVPLLLVVEKARGFKADWGSMRVLPSKYDAARYAGLPDVPSMRLKTVWQTKETAKYVREGRHILLGKDEPRLRDFPLNEFTKVLRAVTYFFEAMRITFHSMPRKERHRFWRVLSVLEPGCHTRRILDATCGKGWADRMLYSVTMPVDGDHKWDGRFDVTAHEDTLNYRTMKYGEILLNNDDKTLVMGREPLWVGNLLDNTPNGYEHLIG